MSKVIFEEAQGGQFWIKRVQDTIVLHYNDNAGYEGELAKGEEIIKLCNFIIEEVHDREFEIEVEKAKSRGPE